MPLSLPRPYPFAMLLIARLPLEIMHKTYLIVFVFFRQTNVLRAAAPVVVAIKIQRFIFNDTKMDSKIRFSLFHEPDSTTPVHERLRRGGFLQKEIRCCAEGKSVCPYGRNI